VDEPTAPMDDRPPVPMGTHRREQRRRLMFRSAIIAGWFLIGLSIVLAIFVHKGLLGISGLVAAAFVAVFMLRPSKLRWWDDDDDFMEESPD
jgi:hypothetical protein